MGRYLHVGLGLGLGLALVGPARAGDGAKPEPAQIEFFEAKVRPLLADKCFRCHGEERQKAGLRVDSIEAIRKGGDTGPAVKPGDPDGSLLVEAVRYSGDVQMPPKGKLNDAEIAALADWVKMGAPWPETAAIPKPAAVMPRSAITAEQRAFWSFRPVEDSPPPAVRDGAWPKGAVDRFLLAALEDKALRPSPPADKPTLIRRATFDLIGLPPSPEEVEAFVKDESPDAFDRVVDRLLASPHYGERWARHWLDIARYGEDQAHSFQPRLYPNGYRYRDWVASALNADMPYDRFIVEQVAGDLLDEPGRLERLPALGFFALGPVYYGDPKKFDQIDDRIDTMSRGFLGLTVACARCHDHKFDPIPTADYYALAGVVASTEYDETPVAPAEVVQAYEKAQAAVKAKEREVTAFLKTEADRLVSARANEIARYVAAAWQVAEARDADVTRLAKTEGLDAGMLKRWVAYLKPTPGKDRPHLVTLERLAERRKNGIPAEAIEALPEVFQAAHDIQHRVEGLLARRADAAGPDKALLQDLVGDKGLLAVPKDKVESLLPADAKPKLAAIRAEVERLKKEAPPKYPVVHALKDGSNPKDLTILLRGNPETPGPVVPRHFLTVLGGDSAPFSHGSGRLELAKAIASPSNPLTARVMVNRLWQHHFGRGLVGTSSNFGALGERPTHPALLDHLAARFVESGWSIKAMHRLMMLSAAYQQGGRFDERSYEIDPDNRLLWRMSRRRLEVEPWRDALLAVSGRLDPAVGGPPAQLDDPKNHRRTVYAAVSRHDLAPLLRLFDFPDPNITSGERSRTTVPLQQLIVLNDEFMAEAARSLAARLRSEGSLDEAARVRRDYALLFSRPPTEAEERIALNYLARPDTDPAAPGNLSRWERYAQALLGSNEFLFVD